jgi:hypothetical protein
MRYPNGCQTVDRAFIDLWLWGELGSNRELQFG